MSGDGTHGDATEQTGTGWVLGGRYRLISKVGAGGMAVVWQAHDDVLARTVAVKLLAAHHIGDPQSRSRIRHEARAAAALSHPNIAQVHDYGEADVAGEIVPYVVMELVRGGTLHQRLNEGPVLPRYAMSVCAEIAAALAAAHVEGLVHRDIKPANVMLSPTGAKVVDFGIAAAIQPSQAGAEDFEVLGTPAYLAPERLLYNAVEPASDVYALGVLLYRLLAGHSPWTSETTTQMLTAHIYVDPFPLLPMFQVPDFVTALCNRCLDKDPAERPSAREVAALLAHGATKTVRDDETPSSASPVEPVAMNENLPGRTDPVAGQRPPAEADPKAAQAPGVRGRRGLVPYIMAPLILVAAAITTIALLHPSRPEATARTPQVSVKPPRAATTNPAPKVSITSTAPTPGATGVSPRGAARTTAGRVTPGAVAGEDTTTTPAGTPTSSRPEPEATTTTTTTAAAPQERTLSSAAGTVRATCPATGTAHILSWSAIKPYKVIDGDTEAGPAPEVSFKHGNTQVTMTVTCSGGVPSATST
ncbi:hypothetical protein GCM10010435_81250 [Winogradskya consettensis]|uniref:non-specific serine/threonine protein kinase n=1 Tax=Winogradskya consettensis TaxID=113560 RepID=A0A919T4S5_9ACTN|nr:serine/threonine-protein kinase [Actinoplanes consettensis]GIM85125.1 hypothetical protein Aco04nite_94690 [Actinoplanes consettensis]